MQCSNCGTKNPDKFKFCKECGEELVVSAPKQAVAPPQQTVVIIKEEKQRRGVPALIWILVGMILVVLLCGLLVWLDFIDVPEQIRVRLPDPIGDFVDAVDNARPPGAPDLAGGVAQDQPGQQWQPPQNPPANQGQQPSQPEQSQEDPDVCDEPWIGQELLEDYKIRHSAYSGQSKIEFTIEDSWFDDLIVVKVYNESGDKTSSDTCSTDGNVICPLDDNWNDPLEWDRGQVTFVFYYEASECYLGEFSIYFDCDSGEEFYSGWPYNGGCCTVGCYCQHPSTSQWGCWQECAPQCIE